MGHSSAVRLKDNLSLSMRDDIGGSNRSLKRRSAICDLSFSSRDDAGINYGPLKRRSAKKCYFSLSARDDTGIYKWDSQTAFALLAMMQPTIRL